MSLIAKTERDAITLHNFSKHCARLGTSKEHMLILAAGLVSSMGYGIGLNKETEQGLVWAYDHFKGQLPSEA